jgi:hypothetical protein
VDAAELSEWEVLYQTEPWGETRGDMQTALVACVQANVWRGKGPAAKPKDFLPDFWSERKQSVEEMRLIGMAFAAGTRANFQKRN